MSGQNPNDHPSGVNPVGIPLLHGPITAAEQQAQEEREKREKKEKSDYAFQERQVKTVEASNNLARKNFRLSIVIAVVSALTCGATWYQSRISSRSLANADQTLHQIKMNAEESSKQFQVQLGHFDAGIGRTGLLAIHAGEQVDRTRELAQTSKDALVSVQRAFVFATGFEGIRVTDPNDPQKIAYLDFSIAWENSGTTPTRGMRQHYSWLAPSSPLPDNYPYPDLGDSTIRKFAIGPKAIVHTTAIRVSAEDIAKVVNKQEFLYIWGWARYRDIFPKSPTHITRYCTQVVGFDGNPLSANPGEFVKPLLSNCGDNCYDEECKVQ